MTLFALRWLRFYLANGCLLAIYHNEASVRKNYFIGNFPQNDLSAGSTCGQNRGEVGLCAWFDFRIVARVVARGSNQRVMISTIRSSHS